MDVSIENRRKYMKKRISESYRLADPETGKEGAMAFGDLNYYRDEFRRLDVERLQLARGIKEIKTLMRASVR